MALINTSLPNLIQGVSQQPDATRFSGQCDEQENFMSSVVDGLAKRNGAQFISRLFNTDISEDSFIHFINRSETERYVLVHDGTKLYAFNILTGEEAEINGSTGGYTALGTYLDVETVTGDSARKDLRATTVSDGTFLVNRNITVATTDEESPELDKEALIFVKQGDYSKDYSLEIEYNTNAPVSAEIDVTYVRTDLGSRIVLFQDPTLGTIQAAGKGYEVGKVYTLKSGDLFATTPTPEVNFTEESRISFKVTAVNSEGGITAATIEDEGSRLDIRPRPAGNFTVSYNLEEGDSTSIPSYQTLKTVSVSSEDDSKAYHADTSRICQIIHELDNSSNPKVPADYHHQSLNPESSNTPFTAAFSGIDETTGNDEFSIQRDGNLLILTRRDGEGDFKIRAKDGLGGNALGVIYKEVGAITDLPLYAKNGFVVKVRGDGDSSADDYYVKFETKDGEEIGKGSWIETIGPTNVLNYKSSTLPLFIVNDAPNSFKLEALKTAPRSVGDSYTNPLASFAGKTIQNSVFFKNRLGFVCEDRVILSEAGLGTRNAQGDFEYNFGRTTVTTLLDSDPIDVVVAADRVTNITAAATSQENLILFSQNGQFVLKGEDLLTPRTVSVKPITNFEYNNETDPVSVGSYIYYPFHSGNFTGIREFSLNKTTDVYESNEITEQVPRYIPKDITHFAGSLTENMLAVVSKEKDKEMYVYKYFFSNNKKVLSSWSKWEFNDAKLNIRGFDFMDSDLYLLVARQEAGYDQTYLLRLALNTDGEDEGLVTHTVAASSPFNVSSTSSVAYPFDDQHVTHLDLRVPARVINNKVAFASYTSGETVPLKASISRFTVGSPPYGDPQNATYHVYTDKGIKLLASINASYELELYGSSLNNYNDENVWVGVEFDSKYTFSEQIFKAQTGQARTPNAAAKQRIKNLSLYHTNTSDYKITVTPYKRASHSSTYPVTTRTSGSDTYVELDDGFFRAPIFADSENLKITLENNGAMPSNFQSAEFETFVHTRSSRYGA